MRMSGQGSRRGGWGLTCQRSIASLEKRGRGEEERKKIKKKREKVRLGSGRPFFLRGEGGGRGVGLWGLRWSKGLPCTHKGMSLGVLHLSIRLVESGARGFHFYRGICQILQTAPLRLLFPF